MTVETAFYTLMSNTAGVTALVSTRIYPDVLPEQAAYPAIVFARSSTDPVTTMSGTIVATTVGLSVGAWAKTRTAADAVSDAIYAAIDSTDFYLSGREAAFDPETGLYATILTISILSI